MRLPNKPFATQGGVVVLAHRGWRGCYPENTMLSFQKAAEMPIDGLEIDIHTTADGVLVVCHDATVERTTDGNDRIQNYTFTELQKLDAGYRFTSDDGQTFPFRGQGITIPALAEVFETYPQLWINIDMKQEKPSMIRSFADLIQQHHVAHRLCVGSFSDQTVADFRRDCPGVARTASHAEVIRLFVLNKLWLSGLYWGQGHVLQIPEVDEDSGLRLVTPRFVKAAHRNNIAVHVWTVNETADMQRLIDIGVDGLISDYPDRVLKFLGRL
ncbi:Glycerophosphoryl diester phosphodiesterase [hydrothermal vent metagenome]|uniref:Glycerophosphoryl diester phosphodiesterase n=1 Tax=hydrothermal vent metagenome TaxID=652676 RepID=A0A3B0V0R7_9ZZZZ